MNNIVDNVNNLNIGLDSYIDSNGDPGRFVSEFMAYHGTWYRDLNQNSNEQCYLAGHVHVGGQISWDNARLAAEETIRKEEKHMLSYLKGWQSPYGYAAWPWVFHWMTRLRQDGFTQESVETVSDRIYSKKRENCLEESHLLGDEMMINKAEPIYLTKEILDDFYRTDRYCITYEEISIEV